MQDCDETVQARLKSRMAARGVDLVMHPWVKGQDAHQIVVVSCLAASARLATDVSRALENIGSEFNTIASFATLFMYSILLTQWPVMLVNNKNQS